MTKEQNGNTDGLRGSQFFERCCYLLLILEAFLAVAYLLLPEFTWGQGRRSYFNFEKRLTLFSWLASMQFLGIAILSLIGLHRDRRERAPENGRFTWGWVSGALVSLSLSFAEMSRIHHRFELLGYPRPNGYEQMIILSISLGLLGLFGWFLLYKLRRVRRYYRFGVGWLVTWVLCIVLASFAGAVPGNWKIWFSMITGLLYLSGGTLLLMAVARYVLRRNAETPVIPTIRNPTAVPFPQGLGRIWILLGVCGASFTLLFLEIILFQLLTISSDYLTANSIISIALMVSAVGGLIGFFSARRSPLPTMIAASLMLPLSILLVFGTSVMLMDRTLIASLLLMVPFIRNAC